MNDTQTRTAEPQAGRERGDKPFRLPAPTLLPGLDIGFTPGQLALLLRPQDSSNASHVQPLARQILALQRTHGNQYAQRLLRSICEPDAPGSSLQRHPSSATSEPAHTESLADLREHTTEELFRWYATGEATGDRMQSAIRMKLDQKVANGEIDTISYWLLRNEDVRRSQWLQDAIHVRLRRASPGYAEEEQAVRVYLFSEPRLSAFFEGLVEGWDLSEREVAEHWQRLERERSENRLLRDEIIVLAFIGGAAEGVIEEIQEAVEGISHLITHYDEFVAQLGEVIGSIISDAGPQVMRMIGEQTGSQYASEIRGIIRRPFLEFVHELGKYVGPSIVQAVLTVLSLVAPEAGAGALAVRLAALIRRIPGVSRGLRALRMLMRRDVPDLDAPDTDVPDPGAPYLQGAPPRAGAPPADADAAGIRAVDEAHAQPDRPPSTDDSSDGARRIPPVSEPSEVVGSIDRETPLAASGDPGSLASRPGFGVFAARIRTADGTEVDGVVKIYPAANLMMQEKFAQEIAGARAAATTGYGPRFFGEVRVAPHQGRDGRAFAMERVEGGFPIAEEGATAVAAEQAQAALAALSPRSIQDVRAYGDALLRLEFHCSGEVQGLIGPGGRWRPIDFQGVSRLPADPSGHAAALREHARNIGREAEHLEGLLASRPVGVGR